MSLLWPPAEDKFCIVSFPPHEMSETSPGLSNFAQLQHIWKQTHDLSALSNVQNELQTSIYALNWRQDGCLLFTTRMVTQGPSTNCNKKKKAPLPTFRVGADF